VAPLARWAGMRLCDLVSIWHCRIQLALPYHPRCHHLPAVASPQKDAAADAMASSPPPPRSRASHLGLISTYRTWC
jgi:hypothetical protein